MAANSIKVLPLVVLVGPTASGKTTLAIEMAKKFDGEIICADSRTVYMGMDIGTAKPTKEEQAQVPHWGLDLVSPGERFTVADFKVYATKKIDDIRARGHIPFLVGGTGLYVDAILFDYQFGSEVDNNRRAELEQMTTEQLQEHCFLNNITLPENRFNKRYVIRAIERKGINIKRKSKPVDNCIIVGIATERDILCERIAGRTEQLFNDGVVEEATLLGEKYGWKNEAMTGNIYPLVHLYLESKLSLDEIKDKFTTLDQRLAKRQLTWLRRNPYIVWGSLTDIRDYLAHLLVSEE